jgi:hypothetical protein
MKIKGKERWNIKGRFEEKRMLTSYSIAMKIHLFLLAVV